VTGNYRGITEAARGFTGNRRAIAGAIDNVPVEALVASQFALCRQPHSSLVEPWAAAYAAVLERFLAEREHGEERRDRALL